MCSSSAGTSGGRLRAVSTTLRIMSTATLPSPIAISASSLSSNFRERAHAARLLAETQVMAFGLDQHTAAEDVDQFFQRGAGAHRRAQIDVMVAEEAEPQAPSAVRRTRLQRSQ